MVQKQSKGFQVVINLHSDMKLAYVCGKVSVKVRKGGVSTRVKSDVRCGESVTFSEISDLNVLRLVELISKLNDFQLNFFWTKFFFLRNLD